MTFRTTSSYSKRAVRCDSRSAVSAGWLAELHEGLAPPQEAVRAVCAVGEEAGVPALVVEIEEEMREKPGAHDQFLAADGVADALAPRDVDAEAVVHLVRRLLRPVVIKTPPPAALGASCAPIGA